jgi:hypothetical protein
VPAGKSSAGKFEESLTEKYNSSVRTTLLFLFAVPFAASWGQPLMVYSELATLDPKAQVVSPASPREILSPGVVRNGFTSLQVAVDVPADKPWEFDVAQNPDEAVEVTLYRVTGDRLEKVANPVVIGKGPAVFWLDMWAKKNAPVERIKVEPQLHIDDDWVIYPMEGRVTDAIVPDAPAGGWPGGTSVPGEVLRGFACGQAAPKAEAPKGTTLASLRYRNAQQDLALAEKRGSKAEIEQRLGACDAPLPENPERYLRVRDFLFGAQ